MTFRDGINKGEAYFDWNTYTYIDPNAGNTTGLNDGTITSADIMQINHYYPFGLNMEGNWNGSQGGNKYQYNGKEWNDDFGLGWNDYGARFYDPAIGRWTAKDPMAEKYIYQNPYNYVSNNPIKMIDPDGRDNIIYVVMLPGNDKAATRNLEKELNKLVKSAKMNVKIHMVTDSKNFDIKKIDKTDGVAVVGGSKNDVANYIKKNFDGYVSNEFKNGEVNDGRSLTSFLSGDFNPEITDGGGENGWNYVTAVSTEKYEYDNVGGNATDISKEFGVSDRSLFVAFNILHGVGHLSGIEHGKPIHNDRGFMSDGKYLQQILTGQGAYALGKIDNLVKETAAEHADTMSKINSRFPQNITPKLNYEPK